MLVGKGARVEGRLPLEIGKQFDSEVVADPEKISAS